MSNQTAVEWLIGEYAMNGYIDKEIIEKANQMMQEQIMKSYYDGMQTNFDPNMGRAELYYQEIYGDKDA